MVGQPKVGIRIKIGSVSTLHEPKRKFLGQRPHESMRGRLKVGRLYGRKSATLRQAMDEAMDWLNFYNHKRFLGSNKPSHFWVLISYGWAQLGNGNSLQYLSRSESPVDCIRQTVPAQQIKRVPMNAELNGKILADAYRKRIVVSCRSLQLQEPPASAVSKIFEIGILAGQRRSAKREPHVLNERHKPEPVSEASTVIGSIRT